MRIDCSREIRSSTHSGSVQRFRDKFRNLRGFSATVAFILRFRIWRQPFWVFHAFRDGGRMFDLGTASRLRKNLAGIQQFPGIEKFPDADHVFQVFTAVRESIQDAFSSPIPCSRTGTRRIRHRSKGSLPRQMGVLHFFGDIIAVEDQWMRLPSPA